MDDKIHNDEDLIVLGGKFSAKITYRILKSYGNHKIIVFDESLDTKFFEGDYDFVSSRTELKKKIMNGSRNCRFVFATSSMSAKKSWIKFFNIQRYQMLNIVSKDFVTNNSRSMGFGNLIWSDVTLDYDSEIGNLNFINNATRILHDSIVGSHNFFGPNVTLLGNSKIGDNCFLGANSIIDAGVIVGDNCVIGANSFVNKDLSDGLTVFGTPAKIFSNRG